jgi:hypothetical protein
MQPGRDALSTLKKHAPYWAVKNFLRVLIMLVAIFAKLTGESFRKAVWTLITWAGYG